MIEDRRISDDEFFALRPKVLSAWSTGKDVDLEEAFKFHQTLGDDRSLALAMHRALAQGQTLLQPRAGVATLNGHIQLLRYLQDEGQADLLPTTIDAYTRQNRYEESARGLEKSRNSGLMMLNGFPAVNHGLNACREVVQSVSKPVQVRHGTPDARLLAEITLAAGFTGFEGGGISYNVPYAKKVPLERSLADWQYVDKLVGIYESNGVRINREPFGPLTGTLVPPFISHTVGIIEGLLALRQGVRSITLGYGQTGSLAQDLAAVVALRELADEYFRAAGYDDFELSIVFHQWMGGFPEDEAKAFAVISWGSVAAVLAGAEKIIVKTPHEAAGIPTKEANVQGLRATRQVINIVGDQKAASAAIIKTDHETDLIKAEVRCLIEKTRQLGDGDIALGVVRAFEAGVIDVPFAPTIYNVGKVLPMRDNMGFVRIFKKGNLPLSDEILNYHHCSLQDRAKAEGRPVSFQMVTDDVYAISKGKLIGRPR